MKKEKTNVVLSIKIPILFNFIVLFKIYKCLSYFEKYYALTKIIYNLILHHLKYFND